MNDEDDVDRLYAKSYGFLSEVWVELSQFTFSGIEDMNHRYELSFMNLKWSRRHR